MSLGDTYSESNQDSEDLLGEFTILQTMRMVSKSPLGAREMPQWVNMLATKRDELSFTPRIYLVERENQLGKLPSDPCTYTAVYRCPRAGTHK